MSLTKVIVLLLLLSAATMWAGDSRKAVQLSGGVEAASLLLNDEAPGAALVPRRACTTALGDNPLLANVLVDCDFVNLPHNESPIAVNPNNPAHIITGANTYEFFFKGSTLVARSLNASQVSTDGGFTWATRYVPLGGFNTASDPVFAFDLNDHVFFANIAYHTGQGGAAASNGSIIVNRSDDGGLTWGDPVVVDQGSGNYATSVFNDKEWLVADTWGSSPYKNNLYLTWTKFVAFRGLYIRSAIWFARSTDGGRTFSTPVEISGSGAFCTTQVTGPANQCDEDQFSVPAVGPAGEIYVAFQNSNTAAPDYRNNYLVVKSTDGGLTWGAPVVAAALVDGFNDYPLNVQGRQTFTGVQFRTASAGNIAVGPEGNVYLAFADNRNGSATNTNTDVLVVTSTTGGATWSAPELVSGAASDQFYPWLAVGQAAGSQPQVLFMDRSYDATAPTTGKYGITLARKVLGSWVLSAVHTGLSDPNNSRWFGGLTGGQAVFIGDYNGLAVASDGTAWGAWTDMRRTVTTSGKKGQNIFVAGR